jgi:sugar lactone lactonase YvrE
MADQANAAFEVIADGLYLEGLAVDHERDVIWYSDVIGGGIRGVRRDGSKVATFNEGRMWTGGVLMNAGGSVLSSGQGGIMWNHPDGSKSGWLLDTIDGQPINGINEMVPDGTGGIFFGTVDLEMVIKGETARPTAIYRLSRDRQVTKLADEIGFTNGIIFDEQRRRFYCNDTFTGTWVFHVTEDLMLRNKTRLIDKEDADGMALDAEGNVWITGFRSGFVTVVSPQGSELERFQTPEGAITQVRFGGEDMQDLYFNSVPAAGGDTLKEGGEITSKDSFLYRTRSPVPGQRVGPAQFELD